MDVPAIYGPVVHTLSFAEAARRGIICNYKVIISVVTSDMINADLLSKGEVIVEGDVVRARTVANQIAIQKACQEHDLKKVFSFHRNVASARDFTGDTASSIKAHLPDFKAYHVNGGMQTARREKEMRAFREASRAIMSNARCLTEGVDVPAVDVVAFLSPRKSKVDIVQAAGRAMRTAPGKETGYVLLPLFLETHENESLEEAVKRTDYEEAWDVLQAMQEQDSVLAEVIREMREERGRLGGFDDSRLRERVEVLGPEVSLEDLRDAVSTALIERLGATWDERYGELKRYRDENGHCEVPRTAAGETRLAVWCHNQRKHRYSMVSERRSRLDALGFIWNPHTALWEEGFQRLGAFVQEKGHCAVPKRYVCADGYALGRWVEIQRQSQDRLLAERKPRLDALSFNWDIADTQWEEGFKHLEAFVREHGHCRVPKRYVTADGHHLGEWVSTQRRSQDSIPAERSSRLDAVGFIWDSDHAQWEEGFKHLEAFFREHGHCKVPRRYVAADGHRLGLWLQVQRSNYDCISIDRKTRLDALGLIWNPLEAQWEDGFKRLEAFVREFGHCRVLKDYKDEDGYRLGAWVSYQRSNQNCVTRVSAERKARLDALGFDWSAVGPRRSHPAVH
jgi:hypothetical protein